MKKPLLLCILDGYGLKKPYPGNAIKQAKTPFIDYLFTKYPWKAVNASENWVGLPQGQMGNSEVGHLNIGAGRIVDQPFVQINKALANDALIHQKVIVNAVNYALKKNKQVHIFGLLSDGGVHSHINHIKALYNIFHQANLKTYIHAFMDGRDTPPYSGKTFINEIKKMNLASISGRYFAMDRDKNFSRLQKVIDMMIHHKATSFLDPLVYMEKCYQQKISDEFITPAYNDNLQVKIRDGDVIVMANFRPDRANQITATFTAKNYQFMPQVPANIYFVSMTKLADYTNTKVVFPLQKLTNTLGDWLANNGYHQLRIAETEKYAHVTFFFDGGIDKPILNSQRILIDSKDVATYDLAPEMALLEITATLEKEIIKQKHDVIILNFANPDMVGHTGKLEATIKAIEWVDHGLKRIYDALQKVKGTLIFTSDHGNAEEMIDEQGNPKTAHTKNLVPFLITDPKVILTSKKTSLSGVAPAIIKYLKQKIPQEMTANSIIEKILL